MKTAAELAAGGLANAKGTGQLDKMQRSALDGTRTGVTTTRPASAFRLLAALT